jgi:hypothetical protein
MQQSHIGTCVIKSKMKDEILSAKSITIKSLKSLETLDFVLSP